MKSLEYRPLDKHPRIGLAEEANPDATRVAIRHVKDGFILPVLTGHEKEILWHAKELGADIDGMGIADMESFANKAEMVSRMLMICRNDWTKEACEDKLKDINYSSTMYLGLGCIDGLVGGVIATTAETMRLALRLIQAIESERTVSGCVLPERDNIYCIMGNRTLSVDPSVQELVETTLQCARTAQQFGTEPKVGILPYSSFGSGSGESVDEVRVIAEHLKWMSLDPAVDEEIQVDAAISPIVTKIKAPHSAIVGEMNTLIFPNIDTENIGYKIAVELSSFTMFGPILQGLRRPVSILMCRASVDTIYSTGTITGVQTVENRP